MADFRMIVRKRGRLVRFFSRVDVSAGGCWNWTGSRNRKGYGHFASSFAHRFAFAWFVGPIADGLEVDHLCRNTRCVNPLHLEAVTPRENRRRASLSKWDRLVCRNGHDWTATRQAVPETPGHHASMVCAECRRVSQRACYARRQARLLMERIA